MPRFIAERHFFFLESGAKRKGRGGKGKGNEGRGEGKQRKSKEKPREVKGKIKEILSFSFFIHRILIMKYL